MVSTVTERIRERSSITAVQFDTIRLREKVRKGQLTVERAARSRSPSGGSVGTYYRILHQARGNLRRAVFTVLFAARLQLIQMERLTRLLDLANQTPEEMPERSTEEFVAVLEALVNEIVMS